MAGRLVGLVSPRVIGLALLVGLLPFAAPVLAADPSQALDRAAFLAQVVAAQRLAAACATAAATCDLGTVPADEQISAGPGSPAFRVTWQWLRDALEAAKKQPGPERTASMEAAEAHLAELAAEANGSPTTGDAAPYPQARAAADKVLASSEFRAAEGPTWFERRIARVQDCVLRLFLGLDRLGTRNPWLAPLIEWACFLLAAAGLVFFIRRSLARQALRISLGQNAATANRAGRDSTDWARLAEEHAAAGDWREAIHCLYWAAVVALEARRAWRPNPARTPREYLRLLETGSDAHRALRELTQTFERSWYGHTAEDEAEFRAAQASFARLRTAALQRSGLSHPATGNLPPGTATAEGVA